MQSKYSRQLTVTQVQEILAAPLAMRHADLAEQFGVTASTISRIRKGLTWSKHDHENVPLKVPPHTAKLLKQKANSLGTTPYVVAEAVITRWASRQK